MEQFAYVLNKMSQTNLKPKPLAHRDDLTGMMVASIR